MRYNVKAQAFSRDTGEPRARSRTEAIDTIHNPLFNRCKTVMDIKETYERFWNEMNAHSTEVVFVQRITILK
jgi:hypothetical protein